MNVENVSIQPDKETQELNNTLNTGYSTNSPVGKTYNFSSARYATLRNLINGKIRSEVTFSNDRLLLDVKPKHFNTLPVVLYEDIIGITVSIKIHFYHCFFIAVSIILAFLNPLCLIAAVIFFLVGRDRRITITQRSGISAIIYSRSKEQAEDFKNDVMKVANIH